MIDDQSLDDLFARACEDAQMPGLLVDRVESRIVARGRNRRNALGVLALIAIASGVVTIMTRPSPTAGPDAIQPGPEILAVTRPARVELDDKHFTERLETAHPNVTIVRVYQRHIDPDPLVDPASKAPEPGLPGNPQTERTTRSS